MEGFPDSSPFFSLILQCPLWPARLLFEPDSKHLVIVYMGKCECVHASSVHFIASPAPRPCSDRERSSECWMMLMKGQCANPGHQVRGAKRRCPACPGLFAVRYLLGRNSFHAPPRWSETLPATLYPWEQGAQLFVYELSTIPCT